jgi:putative ABC transport system ATP-binding protein
VARALVTEPALLLADEPTGNLDTHSTSDVLDVFDQLSASGRTIVLITHEPEVGDRTKRLVRLVDGQIVTDTRQSPIDQAPVGAHAARHAVTSPSVADWSGGRVTA